MLTEKNKQKRRSPTFHCGLVELIFFVAHWSRALTVLDGERAERKTLKMAVLSDLSANEAAPRVHRDLIATRKALVQTASEAAAAKKAAATKKLHTSTEAKQLCKDAALHEWLRKHQKRGADAKPRMYFTKFRRDSLEQCFKTIDRDGSGAIDKGELVFALVQLGLDSSHAAAILAEGDRDENGDISLPEFFALVAKVMAREAQVAAYKAPSSSRAAAARLAPVAPQPNHKEQRSHAAAESREAAANSLRDLVDRAASFPIGLLANAHQISSLIEGFDPDAYASRCTPQEAEGAWWRGGKHPVNAIDGEQASGAPAPPALELSKEGLLRLPRLASVEAGRPESATSTGGGSSSRPASATLKSTTHTRWLQRGRTMRGSQLLNPLPSAAKPVNAAQPKPRPRPSSSPNRERGGSESRSVAPERGAGPARASARPSSSPTRRRSSEVPSSTAAAEARAEAKAEVEGSQRPPGSRRPRSTSLPSIV